MSRMRTLGLALAITFVTALAGVARGAHAPAAAPRPAPPAHRPIVRGAIPDHLPTHRRVVALTFDAGGDAGGAPRILAALSRAQVTATFFMTGRWAQRYRRQARVIAARYPVANHTYDHADLLGLSLAGVRREVLAGEQAITRVTQRAPVRLFRFPYGSSNAATLRVVNDLRYTAVGWTVDTLGWEGTSMGRSVSGVMQRALGGLRPGEIILMHAGANPADRSTLDADALTRIIGAIRRRGYRFIAVDAYL